MSFPKYSAVLAIMLAALLSSCGTARRITTMQVGSYNLRYENRGDSLRGHGDCRQDFSVSKRMRDRDKNTMPQFKR